MSVLDTAIANIALPIIARELHTAPSIAVWVSNAYQLAIMIPLLPLAAVEDRIGQRHVCLPARDLFIAGSLACALSRSLPMLIAAGCFKVSALPAS